MPTSSALLEIVPKVETQLKPQLRWVHCTEYLCDREGRTPKLGIESEVVEG